MQCEKAHWNVQADVLTITRPIVTNLPSGSTRITDPAALPFGPFLVLLRWLRQGPPSSLASMHDPRLRMACYLCIAIQSSFALTEWRETRCAVFPLCMLTTANYFLNDDYLVVERKKQRQQSEQNKDQGPENRSVVQRSRSIGRGAAGRDLSFAATYSMRPCQLQSCITSIPSLAFYNVYCLFFLLSKHPFFFLAMRVPWVWKAAGMASVLEFIMGARSCITMDLFLYYIH